MSQNKSLFSKDFWLLALINLLVMTAYYGLMVTTPQFAADRLQTSASIAGLIAGVTVLGILVARFTSGYLTQRFRTKALLICGAVLLVPASLAYHLANTVLMMLLVRFIHGISIGLISTVTNTAVVLLFPSGRKGAGIGYFTLSTILATAVGPFLGLLLMQVSFAILFDVVTVSAVLVLLMTLLVNRNRIQLQAVTGHVALTIKSFIEPHVLPIALAMFFVSLSYAALQTYISFYAQVLHLATLASYFFLVYAVAVLCSRPFTGQLLDQHSENLVIMPAIMIEVIGLGLLAVAQHGGLFLLSAILIGLGFGNFQSAAQTVVTKIVPATRLSQATATYFIIFDLSLGVGPFLLGLIVPHIGGYRQLFVFCGGLSLVGLVAYYLLYGHQVAKRIQSK